MSTPVFFIGSTHWDSVSERYVWKQKMEPIKETFFLSFTENLTTGLRHVD